MQPATRYEQLQPEDRMTIASLRPQNCGVRAMARMLGRSPSTISREQIDDATTSSALAGFTAKLNAIADPMRKSFTYDLGKEMSDHRQLAAATGVRVYFCDPHSPWLRGTCENTDGLLRQYLAKGTDLSVHSQDNLDDIADSLNGRPRATHGFNTPLAVFSHLLAMARQAPGLPQ